MRNLRLFRSRTARRTHRETQGKGRSRLLRGLREASFADRAALTLATVGGVGFLPRGGSLAACLGALASWALAPNPWVSWSVLVTVVLGGTWALRVAIRIAGVEDPGQCVVDEVAGAWLACLASGLQGPWLWVPLTLFVLMDAWKPWPANLLEERAGSLGVMADDLAAGAWAALSSRILALPWT